MSRASTAVVKKVKTVAMAAVAASAIAGAMIACSSSSSNGGTTGQCGGTGTGSNQACESCAQSHCSSQYNACFSGGGACVAWANGGCSGLPDSTCSGCLNTVVDCEQTNCATECQLTSNDSGVPDGSGFTDTGTPTTPNCVALETCCNDPSLPADAKSGCLYLAGANNDDNCKSGLASFQSAGYCK